MIFEIRMNLEEHIMRWSPKNFGGNNLY